MTDHWYERNEERFNQLVERLLERGVVPFVGAGVSVAGGFPSWKDHLRQQGRTAGIDSDRIEGYLAVGQYETIIEEIENIRGRDVFAQEIRDVFQYDEAYGSDRLTTPTEIDRHTITPGESTSSS